MQHAFADPGEDMLLLFRCDSVNNRRFTRLTNAHSKSPKHQAAMQAIFYSWYNFVRPHQALKRQTPAIAAEVVGNILTIKELLEWAAAA